MCYSQQWAESGGEGTKQLLLDPAEQSMDPHATCALTRFLPAEGNNRFVLGKFDDFGKRRGGSWWYRWQLCQNPIGLFFNREIIRIIPLWECAMRVPWRISGLCHFRFCQKSKPGGAYLISAPFGACFPSIPKRRGEKNLTTLLIMWGGHRQHPTPTPVIVSSNYKLSGKLFKDRNRSNAAPFNSSFRKRNIDDLGFRFKFYARGLNTCQTVK